MYDIAIIGAGVIGNSIARELSRYKLNIIIIEKENDVSNGTTKANSAIVHAGYDAEPGTKMAKFNSKGNKMFDKLCDELDVPFKRTGSLVLAFSDEDMETLKVLYDRGIKNNVPNLEIIDRQKTKEMEPNITDEVVGALYAPTAGIVSSYQLGIALAENAMDNGVELMLNNEVKDIQKTDNGYKIITSETEIDTKYVINCAGVYSDKINNMVAEESFKITPRRGQYYILDKSTENLVNHVVFQCPTKLGKGVLVSPTVHGNILIGPDSQDLKQRDALQTTQDRLDFIKETAKKSIVDIPFNKSITNFAGMRAEPSTGDFIAEESKQAKGFINVAGIKSPGLSSSPAIAEYVVNIVKHMIGNLEIKESFNPRRRKAIVFDELSEKEKAEIIKKNPRYGRIICRCEHITEGEIVDCIHRNAGATTVDGVKRRVRPGTGRCQGGFCGPRVIEILARELNKDINEIVKDSKKSYILTEPTKTNSYTKAYDIVVIGGGPAGLAAAIEAKKNGVNSILVVDRDRELGGILQQCIHNGFGLHIFKEELTGPQYSERFINELNELGIEYKLDTMVLDITNDRVVNTINTKDGFMQIKAQAIILAMGCRERPRGALGIPGTRPAGIFTAGTAQRFINMEGYMVGKKVVILGSGDVGLIMARRLTLEGAKVEVVAELMPYSGGLTRNIVQCLHDFDIPLLLNHTVINIKGKDRVEGVTIAEVDKNRKPIPGTEKFYECDTLLLSVGLIPENELSKSAGVELDPITNGPKVNESMETSVKGIFACGNVVHVHDLVDYVTEESMRAGKNAAKFVKNELIDESKAIYTTAGEGIRYIVPHKVRTQNLQDTLDMFMRATDVYKNVKLVIKADGKVIKEIKKRYLAPGEMERVKVAVDDIKGKDISNITVSVEGKVM